MGDGWEIEKSSSDKVQSASSNTRSHSISEMRNSEGPPHELSKLEFDFKSTRRFSERIDIAHFDSILLRDNKTSSSLQDLKQDRAQNPEKEILTLSCGFVGNNSLNEKIYSSEITVEEEDEALKINSNMNMERKMMLGNISSPQKYQCSSFKDNGKTKENNGSQRTVFKEKNAKDFSILSFEGKIDSHDAVMSSREDKVSSIAVCREEHASKETNPAEIMHNKPPRLQEKDTSKRRISFRALVRMKGLGRRMRKKHQTAKRREKYSINHKNESGNIKEFKSDSSAKHLLESSTSTSEEQTLPRTQLNIAPRKEQQMKSLQRPESLNHHKDTIFQTSDEFSHSPSENDCSSVYLERRRGAVCEELEKTLICGEQSLADLRAILVVQQKLSGFGLL